MTLNKNVLITGVSGGLGNALVSIFLENGYQVVGLDLNESNRHDDRFIFYQVDITDYKEVREIKEDLTSKGIEIEVLVNNAGIFRFFPVSDSGGEVLTKYLGVNTVAPFHLIHCFLKDLESKKGIVVQVSSENVKVNGIFQPYPASKIALEAFSTASRQELKLLDIKLVLVRPGAIDTPLLEWHRFESQESRYYPYVTRLFEKAMKQVSKPIAPEKVASLIFNISQKKNPKRVYHINNSLLVSILSLFPIWLQDWIMVKAVKN